MSTEEPRVYIVHLRRPTKDKDEQRTDPLWEFGSFGCTKCHCRNLLHPKRAWRREGARLAFAQGGKKGFRLVMLTGPITVRHWKDRCEAQWDPQDMPFRYADAPLLVRNDGASDFPKIRALAKRTRRSTLEGGFSSCFRTRSSPLIEDLAAEVIEVYQRMRKAASALSISKTYVDALPQLPPRPDTDRAGTYRRLLAECGGRVRSAHSCTNKPSKSGKKRCS
jgi:hypothetical protein